MTTDLRGSKEETLRANLDLRSKNIELDQRRRYTETVLANITAGVVSMDHEGNIETANRSARRMLRFTDTSPQGKHYSDVLEPPQREIVDGLLREAAVGVRQTVGRQVDLAVGDRTLTVFMNCVRLSDEGGKPLGNILVLDDLSELLKAQRMAAWQEVARRIAHEIKNPLTPIQLSAQRLQKRYAGKVGEDEGVFTDCTQMIVRQVEEMKLLVNEFSKFARMAEIKTTPNDINEIVGEAILLYQEAHKNISFKFQRDGSIPVFRFDRDQIKRVLINVLDNAVAAIVSEGEVIITTRRNDNLNSAVVEIADTGCGIPREVRNRLFEPYFSTKRKGTGLGLAIVNRIIQDHNGYIRVHDNEPRGTVVSFELPLGARGREEVA